MASDRDDAAACIVAPGPELVAHRLAADERPSHGRDGRRGGLDRVGVLGHGLAHDPPIAVGRWTEARPRARALGADHREGASLGVERSGSRAARNGSGEGKSNK